MDDTKQMSGADIAIHVGHIIRLHRTKAHWSQDALADALNMTRSAVSKIERGISCTSIDVLYRASRLLKFDPTLYFSVPENSPFSQLSNPQDELFDQFSRLPEQSVKDETRAALLNLLDTMENVEAKKILFNHLFPPKDASDVA